MQWYEPLHDRFTRFCRSRTYGDMPYQDLMQETILICFKKMDTIDKESFLGFMLARRSGYWLIITEKRSIPNCLSRSKSLPPTTIRMRPIMLASWSGCMSRCGNCQLSSGRPSFFLRSADSAPLKWQRFNGSAKRRSGNAFQEEGPPYSLYSKSEVPRNLIILVYDATTVNRFIRAGTQRADYC